MQKALFPVAESTRLQVLHSLQILDTPPDAVLDGLVRSAAAITGCPVSLISLADRDRQWFKARVGLAMTETPRASSFCAHTILGGEVFEVPDAWTDPRFVDNPLVVSDPHARFYAGSPILIGGQRIGALCVMDRVPRVLTDTQRAVLKDLTKAVELWIESAQMAEALRSAQRYTCELFENLGDAVILLDHKHAILDANTAAVQLFGYSRGTLLQLGLHEILDEDERDWLRRQRATPGEPLPAHPGAWGCLTRSGRRFPAELRVRSVDDGRYLASIEDVEERNARDEQLLQLSLAVERSTESIVSTGLDSRILYANPAALAMSGYSRDELIGQNARVLGSGKTPPDRFADLYAHLGRGQPWHGDLSNRRKDGSEYVQSVSISASRSTNGTVTQYVAVMKDVTEERKMVAELAEHRHHLEELVDRRTRQLEHATRAAEAANQAKSAFLATMSHEIRTPMNGVVGILEALRRSTLNAFQLDLVETMGESAFALLNVIDDILDFSKIEAGRLTLECENVDLTALVESVCSSLMPVARSRDVRLHVFVDPRLPGWIHTDPVRVRQIMNNLIGNAIKFSSGADRPGRISVRAQPGIDGTLSLTVTDNGIGIAEEARARIFRPFEQAEGSTTRSFGGTGLGLSICNRLCDLLGGSIGVDSRQGGGSIFSVTLPMTPVHVQPAGEATHLLAGVHCRIVSADEEVQRDWSIYLNSYGATTETHATIGGLHARLVCDPAVPCVVVIDARDDEVSLQALDALRASFHLPLVLVCDGQRREPRVVDGESVHLESRLVFRESLQKAVAIVAGYESAHLPEAPLPLTAKAVAPSIDEARAEGRLILVAEDNPINQKVIRIQLGMLGYAVEIASNGVEALAAWRGGRFGLLLTDLQMPVMDGYELARTIRQEETSRPRLPIIALTANTLRGEDGHCRDAGMDDHMTKPLQLDALSLMLVRWVPASGAVGTVQAPASIATIDPLASRPVLDSSILSALIGDEADVIAEFLHEFRGTARAAAEEIRLAAGQEAWAAIGEVAHRLKSSAMSVGALALGDCCERLEEALGAGAPAPVLEALDAFAAAAATVEAALAERAQTKFVGATIDVPSETASRPIGVIILDDDRTAIDRLSLQLQDIGIAPLISWCDGRHALDWLRDQDTSALLLLLDLHMPGMDGIDFMRRLSEQGYHGSLAIVSSADVRVLETASKLAVAQKLQMLGHFSKPLSDRKLEGLIDSWRGFVPVTPRGENRSYSASEILRGIVNDELVLHYQPKVAVGDGRLMGVEALVRWQHPLHGLVPPAAFIGVVEADGGIDMLTDATISLALTQARKWIDAGFPCCIAINISAINLLRLDFPDMLIAKAERHGVPFADIRLEVTESRLISDLRSQIGSLTRLKLKGTTLSIDDFGTGHSSLAQLRDIPFDELKIDQSFVHGSAVNQTQRAIFMASLGMAHDLGMKAVAEGVEDRADWDFVKTSGVDFAQGYFIARPMHADDIETWAGQWTERLRDLLP